MRRKVKEKQVYILTKYVLASSAAEAIRLDKYTDVAEASVKETASMDVVAGFDYSAPTTDEESLWERKKRK